MNSTLLRLSREERIRRQPTSQKELAALLGIVDRSLQDAETGRMSADLRFSAAYDAARQLATILLRCAGYRASGIGAHAATFEALPAIMGTDEAELADYFDSCRAKRNALEYDSAGRVSETEARELAQEARCFRTRVLTWVKRHHPTLLQ